MFGNFTPQVNAPLNGEFFCEEVTGLPFHPRIVDVDSKGNIFVLSYDQDVWRSVDNGISWTKVFDDGQDWTGVPPVTTRDFLTLFLDSQDRVFVNIASWHYAGYVVSWNLYRSTDSGNTWSIVLQNTRRSWHMDEASNGSLWFHTYGGRWGSIHRSDDGGSSWIMFYNFSFAGSEDLRGVAVNDNDDSSIWAWSGTWLKKWNGTGWETYAYREAPTYANLLVSDVMFDQNGNLYTIHETHYPHFRISQEASVPSRTTAMEQWDIYWDPTDLTRPSDEHSGDGVRIGDLMLFSIRSQVWASVDGNRWVKVFDTGNATNSDIASISNRSPVFFVEKKAGKLYRLDLTKEDVIKLYYTEYLQYRGAKTNDSTYTVEQRITNGTNHLDLTDVALSNVQVSVKGLSRVNLYTNTGFETGDTSEWTLSGPSEDSHSVTSHEKYEGTYSLEVIKNASSSEHKFIYQGYKNAKKGDVVLLSCYIKGNTTSEGRINLAFRNQSNGIYLDGDSFDLATSWQRISFYFLVPKDVRLRAEIRADKGISYKVWFDAVMVRIFEVEEYQQAESGDTESICHISSFEPYFAGTLDTVNPIITINGSQVPYSGQLANGTESLATSLSGILTGAVQVIVNIQGSGQAILKLNGTRILYEDSIILKGRTSGVYYGRYYGTFLPTTTTSDLIAVTNLQANITALTHSSNRLTLTTDSPSGTTSTTKVYCGDKGEPTSVAGATSWNYNNTSKILTITAAHSSSITITVKWKFAGDVDGDGVVDASDLFDLSKAYGSKSGDLNWNVDCDFNKDNKTDASDLFDLSKNYGKNV